MRLRNTGTRATSAAFERGDQAEEDVDGLAFPAGWRWDDGHAVVARRATHG